MNYQEVNIEINTEFAEIIIAELSQIGYESFIDTLEGVQAYIPVNLFEEMALQTIQQQYQDLFKFQYQSRIIEQQNWNAKWESEYKPVIVAEKCVIKSDFHQLDKKYPYEILINPKMSFGTGHHETTTMMLEHQLEINHQDKDVLDAGCGTGILSIMASKRGAKYIDAIDIDEWAINNTLENIKLNHCTQIQAVQATVKEAPLKEKYAIILANINRNVLLDEISTYRQYIVEKGVLVLSGFYQEDHDMICQTATENSFTKIAEKTRNNWLSIRFQKESS